MVMEEQPAQRRAVLLGASNLVIGFPWTLRAIQDVWGSPVHIHAAIGHGRSYGGTSSVLGRKLPGILQCGLWDELPRMEGIPTAALLTDVGNDLLYGHSSAQIAEWVEICVERLRPVVQKLVICGLPLASLAEVPKRRFYVLRTFLFPKSRLTHETAIKEAASLNTALADIAARAACAFAKPQREWFAWDPIHIKTSAQVSAWRDFFRLGTTKVLNFQIRYLGANDVVFCGSRQSNVDCFFGLKNEFNRHFNSLTGRKSHSTNVTTIDGRFSPRCEHQRRT